MLQKKHSDMSFVHFHDDDDDDDDDNNEKLW